MGLSIYKAGEIVEEYSQDKLKGIGLEIVRDIKDNDEGYIPVKDLWKREAEALLPKTSIDTADGKGFQKKIDPLLEEIYFTTQKKTSITKLKVLCNSLN